MLGWAWLSWRGYGWVVLRLVYDVLKVLIAKGETRCRVCAAVAKGMGSLIENAIGEMEECHDTTVQTLTISRAISTLLDVSAETPDLDAVVKLQASYTSSNTGLLADVSVFVHTSEYYKGLLADFVKFASGSQERLCELNGGLKSVVAAGMSLAKFVPAAQAALLTVEALQPLLRPGSTVHVEMALQAKLKEQQLRIQTMIDSNEFNEYESLPSVTSMLAIALRLWPGADFVSHMAACVTNHTAAVAAAEQWGLLGAAIADATNDDGGFNDASARAVQLRLKKLAGHTPCREMMRTLFAWALLAQRFPGQRRRRVRGHVVGVPLSRARRARGVQRQGERFAGLARGLRRGGGVHGVGRRLQDAVVL